MGAEDEEPNIDDLVLDESFVAGARIREDELRNDEIRTAQRRAAERRAAEHEAAVAAAKAAGPRKKRPGSSSSSSKGGGVGGRLRSLSPKAGSSSLGRNVGLALAAMFVVAILIRVVLGSGAPSGTTPTSTTRAPSTSTTAADGGAPGTAVVPGSGTTPTTVGSLSLHDFRAGECVVWDDRPEGAPESRPTQIVPCDDPHIIELTLITTVPSSHVDYPTDAEWDAINATLCTAPNAALLGGKIDPEGRFASSAIRPTPKGWAAADRTYSCGIEARSYEPVDPAHPYRRFTGKVAGRSQDLLVPVGTCLLPAGGTVPCAEAHAAEVTGSVDLTGKATDLPADGATWAKLLRSDCTRLAGDRTWGYLDISSGSWAAGRRTAQCTVRTV